MTKIRYLKLKLFFFVDRRIITDEDFVPASEGEAENGARTGGAGVLEAGVVEAGVVEAGGGEAGGGEDGGGGADEGAERDGGARGGIEEGAFNFDGEESSTHVRLPTLPPYHELDLISDKTEEWNLLSNWQQERYGRFINII